MSETKTDIESQVSQFIERHGKDRSALIPILIDIQNNFQYIPSVAIDTLSVALGVSEVAIRSVITFYSKFRLTPGGRHTISVCVGTACYVKGAKEITKAFVQSLSIAKGKDTTEDMMFSVEEVACIGCCSLAPAVRIDDVTYGHVKEDDATSVVQDFLSRPTKDFENTKDNVEPKESAAYNIGVCTCSSCAASGAEEIFSECENVVREGKLNANVNSTACTGAAFAAPIIEIGHNGNIERFTNVRKEDVRGVLIDAVAGADIAIRIQNEASDILDRILYGGSNKIEDGEELDLFEERQKKLLTSSTLSKSAMDIDAYIKRGGFFALSKISYKDSAVIYEIKNSMLRGRGGGGFYTWKKWQAVFESKAETKYVVCNADEGDPGAFMDRMILESYPFAVIEGVLIAMKTVGANTAYIYVRSEYPVAVERLNKALVICEERGYMKNSTKDFNIIVASGAGAFVCGEETALIASIEGKRGTPSYRPPYPTEKGLWGAPTLINNVETFAIVPKIVREGGAVFAKYGTDDSKGTKTFALAGKVKRGGLVEIEMGQSIKSIVEDIGGGSEKGGQFKAVQIGGPSGGVIPYSKSDCTIDYDSLKEYGAMMGSGGLVVLDEDDCMVEFAKYFVEFLMNESCGKCAPCRVGTKRLFDILSSFTENTASLSDIDALIEIGKSMKRSSLCGLGKTAANPILSTIEHFRHEYVQHTEGYCSAGKCKTKFSFTVSDRCIGCTLCVQECGFEAISGNAYGKMEIDDVLCTRCASCYNVCPAKAIEKGRVKVES